MTHWAFKRCVFVTCLSAAAAMTDCTVTSFLSILQVLIVLYRDYELWYHGGRCVGDLTSSLSTRHIEYMHTSCSDAALHRSASLLNVTAAEMRLTGCGDWCDVAPPLFAINNQLPGTYWNDDRDKEPASSYANRSGSQERTQGGAGVLSCRLPLSDSGRNSWIRIAILNTTEI